MGIRPVAPKDLATLAKNVGFPVALVEDHYRMLRRDKTQVAKAKLEQELKQHVITRSVSIPARNVSGFMEARNRALSAPMQMPSSQKIQHESTYRPVTGILEE